MKPFSVTVVIPAVVRVNYMDLDRLVTTHQTFDTVENNLTELLKSSDPQFHSPRTEEAMKQEIAGLMEDI